MAKRLPLAEKLYNPIEDETHYVGSALTFKPTLCGEAPLDIQHEWLPTDAPVDCRVCLDIVAYVQRHAFDEPEAKHGKD